MTVSHSKLLKSIEIFNLYSDLGGMCFGVACQAVESIIAMDTKTLRSRLETLEETSEQELKQIESKKMKGLSLEEEKQLSVTEQNKRSFKSFFQAISLHHHPFIYSFLFPKEKQIEQNFLLTSAYTAPKALSFRVDCLYVTETMPKEEELKSFKNSYVLIEKINKIIYINKEGVPQSVEMTIENYKNLYHLIHKVSKEKKPKKPDPFVSQCYTTQQIEEINQLLEASGAPPLYQETSSIVKINEFDGLYDSNFQNFQVIHDLEIYYQVLQEKFHAYSNKLKTPICFLLHSSNHAIAVAWEPVDKIWIFVDANSLPDKITQENKKVSRLVKSSFSNNDIVTFDTEVYTIRDQSSIVKEILTKCQKDPRWKAIHRPTIEKAHKTDSCGAAWLHIAAQNGRIEIVNRLLECKDIDINKATEGGITPLYIAAQNGRVEIVNRLLECKDIDINKATEDGITPLYIAAQNGRVEIVNKLLECKGIDVNKVNEYGSTPLYIAAQNGRIEIVNRLLECKDIDINKATKKSITPLYIAAQNGRVEIVNRLLEHKDIDINKATEDSITPLYIAAYKGRVEIVNKLLERKDIDINKATEDSITPLYIAAHKGRVNIVNKLLECKGIDVNKVNEYGSTPLYIAAQKGYLSILKTLLQHPEIKPNISIQANIPFLLAQAEKQKKLEGLKKLFSEKKIDFKKNLKLDGFSALHSAVFFGYLEIVKALIISGKVDVLQSTENGMSAYELAHAMGHSELADYLKLYELCFDLNETIKDYKPGDNRQRKESINNIKNLIQRGIAGNMAFVKMLEEIKEIMRINFHEHQQNGRLHWFTKSSLVKKLGQVIQKYELENNHSLKLQKIF